MGVAVGVAAPECLPLGRCHSASLSAVRPSQQLQGPDWDSLLGQQLRERWSQARYLRVHTSVMSHLHRYLLPVPWKGLAFTLGLTNSSSL